MSIEDVRSGHRQVTGLLVPLIVAVILGLHVAAGLLLGSAVSLTASPFWLLALVMLLGARRSLGLAGRAPAQGPAPRVWSLPLLRLMGSALVIAAAVLVWIYGAPERVETTSVHAGLSVGMLVIAFAAAVLARYYQATDEAELPDAPGLASMARIGTWSSLIASASALLCALGRTVQEEQLALVVLVIGAALAVELLAHGVGGLVFRPRMGAPFGADLLISRFLGSSFNPVQSIFTGVERTFGVDVRSSWALVFVRRAALPVLLALGLVAWVMSTVVVVDPAQQAMRERFGRVDRDKVLEPGLHVGLPYPFDRVRRVDVQRVREMPIGFQDAKVGAEALWTQYHAAEEYNLLLGDGRDLVTVNAELHYRIGDIHAWLYGTQNPEDGLETLAYRVLMDATVDKTLDQVLSEDIGDFSARIGTAIQDEADHHQLGVEVVAFVLRGLHPPVAVANDYQAVVAAQIDRGTYAMEAQAYRYGALPKAEAAATRATRRAQADEAERLSKARGEAIAFQTLEAQYSANPSLYRFRRRLETVEVVLQDNPHYVIDARIERDGGALWVLE